MIRLVSGAIALLLSATAHAATITYRADYNQIFIVGKIVDGDFQRFVRALKTSAGDVFAVNIVSLGGSVPEAILIGRLIRRLTLATNAPSLANYAPQARVLTCRIAASVASSPCTCVSACFLIWAGGVARSGNDLHIHRIKFDEEFYGNLAPQDASIRYREAMQVYHDYLREMEIPDSIFERLARMPSYATELVDVATVSTLTWPPSFAEWLYARCGSPTATNSACLINQQLEAGKNAVRAYRLQP
jgi:hypothetical protein